MKKIFFFLFLPVLFSLAFAPESNERLTKADKLNATNFTPKQKLKNHQINLEGHLVAHDRFVFVKYLDLSKSDLDSNAEITNEFSQQSYRFHAYNLNDA